MDASPLEQRVQLFRNATRRPGLRAGIAPSESRAIVAADAGEPGKLRLHERPADRRSTQRGVENDRRSALASAVEVQTKSANVHELAWRSNGTHRVRIRLARVISGQQMKIVTGR